MKKLTYLFLACLLMAACDVETSDNGRLDGYWQLCQLDTLTTNGTTDMKMSNIYWGIQYNLLEIRNLNDYLQQVLFRFDYTEDRLVLHTPILKDKLEGDHAVDDPQLLNALGVYSLVEQFAVESLSRKEMILRSNRFRFHFRRY